MAPIAAVAFWTAATEAAVAASTASLAEVSDARAAVALVVARVAEPAAAVCEAVAAVALTAAAAALSVAEVALLLAVVEAFWTETREAAALLALTRAAAAEVALAVALVAAVVAWGVAIGLSGLAHQLWLMIVLLAVAGAADLVSAVYRQSIMQTFAPDRLRGRLQGVFTVVVAGGPRLGDLRAGATADVTGVGASWVGGGFVAAGLALVLATAFPALIRYRPAKDGSETH